MYESGTKIAARDFQICPTRKVWTTEAIQTMRKIVIAIQIDFE
jgi:hypothetical protein